jgi:hypothetical protein
MVMYEEKAEYASWFKIIFIIPAGLFIGAIITALNLEYEPSLFLIGEGAFFVLLFYFIMPRKYQIYQDKLRIVLGTPFGINIPLSTIKEVRHSSGIKAFVYSGIRFATSTKNVIEIVRNKGQNYVISTKNGVAFKEQLNQAIKGKASNRY